MPAPTPKMAKKFAPGSNHGAAIPPVTPSTTGSTAASNQHSAASDLTASSGEISSASSSLSGAGGGGLLSAGWERLRALVSPTPSPEVPTDEITEVPVDQPACHTTAGAEDTKTIKASEHFASGELAWAWAQKTPQHTGVWWPAIVFHDRQVPQKPATTHKSLSVSRPLTRAPATCPPCGLAGHAAVPRHVRPAKHGGQRPYGQGKALRVGPVRPMS